jgi:protein SCO1/2
LPYYNTPDFTPHWISDADSIAALHQVADFAFTDQLGKLVTNQTLAGHVYAANFFFTGCASICPKMTRNLQKVHAAFGTGEDVHILSHSVTPWLDSVPRLRAYARQYDMDSSRWHVVTGSRAAIYTLARQSYFAEQEPGFNKDSTEFLHTERVVLVDRAGHLRGIYNGTVELEIDRMIEDIELLLAEN